MTEDALHKTLFWFIIPVMAVSLHNNPCLSESL